MYMYMYIHMQMYLWYRWELFSHVSEWIFKINNHLTQTWETWITNQKIKDKLIFIIIIIIIIRYCTLDAHNSPWPTCVFMSNIIKATYCFTVINLTQEYQDWSIKSYKVKQTPCEVKIQGLRKKRDQWLCIQYNYSLCPQTSLGLGHSPGHLKSILKQSNR